jgi:hypothetical protein
MTIDQAGDDWSPGAINVMAGQLRYNVVIGMPIVEPRLQ